MRGVAVHLADTTIARTQGPPPPTLIATTDEHGLFEFRDLGPGRYVIGVGLREYVRPGKLDRRRFYRETRDPASATVIELDKAERLELAPFKLALLPADRTITIVVRAPDRDTAAATNVIVTGATRELVDHRGEPVTLQLPFGAAYLIEATPPEGYKIQERAVRIERDDMDRTIDFRVERQ